MKNVNFWVSILRVSTWLQSVETEGRFGLAPSTPAACLALFPPLDRESFKHCGIFTATSTQQNHVPVPNFRNPFFFRKGVPALEFCRAGASRASRAHGRRRAALPTQQPSTCSAWHGIDWTRRFCAVACGRAIIHGIGFATLEMLMIDFDVFFHTLKYSEDIWSSANHGRRRWCFSNISDENFVLEVHEWEYPSRNGNEIDQHMVRSGINYDHVWPVWLRSWFLMVSIWCSSSFDKYLAGMMMIPVVSFILSGCR